MKDAKTLLIIEDKAPKRLLLVKQSSLCRKYWLGNSVDLKCRFLLCNRIPTSIIKDVPLWRRANWFSSATPPLVCQKTPRVKIAAKKSQQNTPARKIISPLSCLGSFSYIGRKASAPNSLCCFPRCSFAGWAKCIRQVPLKRRPLNCHCWLLRVLALREREKANKSVAQSGP